MPEGHSFKRKALSPGALYRILGAELHARRAYPCRCRMPIPFLFDSQDSDTANWRIARPAPCDQGCDALIVDIVRTALLAFDVHDPTASPRTLDLDGGAKVGKGRKPMAAVGWEERIDLCDVEDEVIQVARDFLALLEPWEIALLPAPCKPPKLLTSRDVADFAFEVACWERDHSDRSMLVTKMAALFARASTRLSQLAMAGANEAEAQEQRSA